MPADPFRHPREPGAPAAAAFRPPTRNTRVALLFFTLLALALLVAFIVVR